MIHGPVRVATAIVGLGIPVSGSIGAFGNTVIATSLVFSSLRAGKIRPPTLLL